MSFSSTSTSANALPVIRIAPPSPASHTCRKRGGACQAAAAAAAPASAPQGHTERRVLTVRVSEGAGPEYNNLLDALLLEAEAGSKPLLSHQVSQSPPPLRRPHGVGSPVDPHPHS